MKNKIIFLGCVIAILYLIFYQRPDNELKSLSSARSYEEKSTSDALEYLQFQSEVRAYPDKDIPPDKYFKAFEYVKENMLEADEGDNSAQWTSIGPNNIGGRSLSLAFSPTDTGTIYMGAASGGLWKSTTGGLGANAWTQINTGYPSLAVSWISIDSANPNVIYIGTGENYGYQYSLNGLDVRVTRGMYGIGILKTSDGGNTWTKSLDWSYNNQRGVWRVIFNPKNRNVLYSATSEGVWKTNNGGANWFQVLNYQMAIDLEVNQLDTNIVYVSVGNLSNYVSNPDVGIYKTTNSGATWTELTNGLPSTWSGKATIELYKDNPDYVYAYISNDFSFVGYYTSTDGGGTWTLRDTTIPVGVQGWFNGAHLVKSNDPNTIICGTIDLYKSTNGGTAFVRKSDWSLWNTGATPPGEPESSSPLFAHADHHEFFSNPREPDKLYCITDGGLYRSNDFGETYYSCNGGYVTSQFYGGFANSYQDSIFCIGGLQDNRTAFYIGTVAWYKTFGGDGMWCGVNSQNHNTCYTEYTYGSISRSSNGGVNWFGISPPGAGSSTNYCFVTPYIVCRVNPNVMYVGGINVYKSLIGGGSWQNLGSLGSKALSMDGSSTSTDTVYIGTVPVTSGQPAAIFRTTNGSGFVNVSGSQIPNRYPTDIHVNPNNSSDVYAAFGGFGTGHVYRSTNAGINWIDISGNLPDLPHQSIVIDPLYTQNIYVGNDLGVFVSTNNGANWFSFSNGMSNALVFDLTIVYPNRNIRATTHGNGIYQRTLVQNPVSVVSKNIEVPTAFKLYQNYPNPFNPTTRIRLDIPKQGNVLLNVYDITGKLVKTLINEKLQGGVYEVNFDGSWFASGVYFYKLVVSPAVGGINSTNPPHNLFFETKKMILVK